MHESVPPTPSLSTSRKSHGGEDSLHQDSVSVLGSISALQLESGQSTPVTKSSMGGPAKTKGDTGLPDSSASVVASDPRPPRNGPEPSLSEPSVPDASYNFEDGNVTVQVEQCLFRVHEYKLKEFQYLRPLLADAQKDANGRKTIHVFATSDDFRRMLAVLYSSAYEPSTFTSGTLKSTLRLATTHKHRALREYAIQNLEKRTLQPIERFALSRDCGVTSWMATALDDLVWREEPISVDEAQVLGFEKFTEVASRREAVKFERGSRVKLDMVEPSGHVAVTSPREPLPAPSTSTPTVVSSAGSSVLLGNVFPISERYLLLKAVATAARGSSGLLVPTTPTRETRTLSPLAPPFSLASVDSAESFQAQVREMGARGRERGRGGFRGFGGQGAMTPAQTQDSDSDEL
ncbi:hypothetical protein FRC10_005587 [Ceratobasidium sp. 414]|nr:hypothetical protein FRC10_005587 [Ceratobasidium sp. 414]